MLNVSHELNVKDVVDIYLVSKQNTAEERVNAGKEGPSHTISALEWGKVLNCGKKLWHFHSSYVAVSRLSVTVWHKV